MVAAIISNGSRARRPCHVERHTFFEKKTRARCPCYIMAKGNSVVDVLVLGGHPSAYLAAALLKNKTKFEVMHSCIPNEPSGDRRSKRRC